jgi:hypothetical protein
MLEPLQEAFHNWVAMRMTRDLLRIGSPVAALLILAADFPITAPAFTLFETKEKT